MQIQILAKHLYRARGLSPRNVSFLYFRAQILSRSECLLLYRRMKPRRKRWKFSPTQRFLKTRKTIALTRLGTTAWSANHSKIGAFSDFCTIFYERMGDPLPQFRATRSGPGNRGERVARGPDSQNCDVRTIVQNCVLAWVLRPGRECKIEPKSHQKHPENLFLSMENQTSGGARKLRGWSPSAAERPMMAENHTKRRHTVAEKDMKHKEKRN